MKIIEVDLYIPDSKNHILLTDNDYSYKNITAPKDLNEIKCIDFRVPGGIGSLYGAYTIQYVSNIGYRCFKDRNKKL